MRLWWTDPWRSRPCSFSVGTCAAWGEISTTTHRVGPRIAIGSIAHHPTGDFGPLRRPRTVQQPGLRPLKVRPMRCRICSEVLSGPGKICPDCKLELDGGRLAAEVWATEAAINTLTPLVPLIGTSRNASAPSRNLWGTTTQSRVIAIAAACSVAVASAAATYFEWRSIAFVAPPAAERYVSLAAGCDVGRTPVGRARPVDNARGGARHGKQIRSASSGAAKDRGVRAPRGRQARRSGAQGHRDGDRGASDACQCARVMQARIRVCAIRMRAVGAYPILQGQNGPSARVPATADLRRPWLIES